MASTCCAYFRNSHFEQLSLGTEQIDTLLETFISSSEGQRLGTACMWRKNGNVLAVSMLQAI